MIFAVNQKIKTAEIPFVKNARMPTRTSKISPLRKNGIGYSKKTFMK